MSEPERAESPSARARSTHVAHFLPAGWTDVAARFAPLVARVDRDVPGLQLLILAPTASDTIALARALSLLDGADTLRITPMATPRRARRLAAASGTQVAVGTPAVVQSLIQASAISLAGVTGVGLAAAAELEADAAIVDLVLGEVPRGAAKTLVSASSSPFVERIIEAQMHGARRIAAAAPEPGAGASPAIEILPVAPHGESAMLGDVLEIIDAPSAAIVPADAAREASARAALATLGYAPESPLARIVPDGATAGAALVVFVGAPRQDQWTACIATPPARVVALVTTRERELLGSAAPGARLVTFSPSSARGDAAAAEEALRDHIRRAIAERFPAREMIALEPLLAEFDALVLAGAALRLFEREREAARRQQEQRLAAGAPAAARDVVPRGGNARPARDADRGRPPRRDDRGRPPRGDDRGRPPRSDDRGRPPRGDDRGRPPRRDDRGRAGHAGDRPNRSPRDRQ